MRKHYSQMNRKELKCLTARIKRISRGKKILGKHWDAQMNPTNIKLSVHATKRMEQRDVPYYKLYDVFKSYAIIDCDYDASSKHSSDFTVLLKSRTPLIDNDDIYVVLDLINGTIVSTFRRPHKELYEDIDGLDVTRFNSNMDILSFLSFYKPNLK